MLRSFGLRLGAGVAVVAAILVPLGLVLFWGTHFQWWAVGTLTASGLCTAVTFRGRTVIGWGVAILAWIFRHRRAPSAPTEPLIGTVAMPGTHVAVRWDDGLLVALIELVPRPFTPTVVVDGTARTDDEVDTRLVERLLSVHCPDLSADIVSAGYRIGGHAAPPVLEHYAELVGTDPAPAHRRTWIMLRADPRRAHQSAQRRQSGFAGQVRYLVASTTRLANLLSSSGVDAQCERSFDEFDAATAIDFRREGWSKVRGRTTFTAAYTAAGGPDVWWAAPADRTITRIIVEAGVAPRSVVLLTGSVKPKRPKGFTRVSGGQRAAVRRGSVPVTDRHHQVPIGSAGVLVGRTTRGHHVYLPFDDVDVSLDIDGEDTFTQFVTHAAGAGGRVTLSPQYSQLAASIGAEIGPEVKVAWPRAATFLEPASGTERVMLHPNRIKTPRHGGLTIRPISASEDSPYEPASPR
ncbi:type VII secretion protein EccE [Mycolicibacterium sp. S2-37]|uniref:type VII secretion protein EccE n=1 Tax=Mycolicibacterium sp. S2-37 TaxID=2810297 RepID=UPI0035AC213D